MNYFIVRTVRQFIVLVVMKNQKKLKEIFLIQH